MNALYVTSLALNGIFCLSLEKARISRPRPFRISKGECKVLALRGGVMATSPAADASPAEAVPPKDPDCVVGKLDCGDLREVGREAVFTISTAKIGNGVEQLRDGNLETFWQSDGAAPHHLNIQFPYKTSVSRVCLYLDFGADESYTAKKVTVRAGTTMHDLADVTAVELHKPIGWCQIRLRSPGARAKSADADADGADEEEEEEEPLRTHLLQVRVLSMHQGGKDTHVRQVAVFGPRPPPPTVFKTVDMLQYASIR